MGRRSQFSGVTRYKGWRVSQLEQSGGRDRGTGGGEEDPALKSCGPQGTIQVGSSLGRSEASSLGGGASRPPPTHTHSVVRVRDTNGPVWIMESWGRRPWLWKSQLELSWKSFKSFWKEQVAWNEDLGKR